ncbi:MAG TPA: hypothetical protein VFR48_06885 [Solirubrobacteraceae bacterium]|nr:hypothetical protein [Solirubrobacteraceae bacterium]
MNTFADRFKGLECLLSDRQSPQDGGWPQKLEEVANAPTTIVATAQVLEILRIRGFTHQDGLIKRGLSYLAKQVRQQTQPTGALQPGVSRGEWTRLPAYALWGLMRYPAVRQEKDIAAGIGFAYSWLLENRLEAGGWSQSRPKHGELLWLPGTMVAVHALERLGMYSTPTGAKRIDEAVNAARDHVTENAQRHQRQRYWEQMVGGGPCAGATGLAVLTLARGSQEHRDVARQGIDWLAANRQSWTEQVSIDKQVDTRTWRILSFSLGLRALMHPCGERDFSDPAVAEVVSHIDKLWHEADQGWAEDLGMHASTSGSYAVISAIHTLKRVWPFDPFQQLGLKVKPTPAEGRRPRGHRVMSVCEEQQGIYLEDDSGPIVRAHIKGADAQWSLLLFLAKRHFEAVNNGTGNDTDRTISLKEYCAFRGNVDPEAVVRARARLHKRLDSEAKKQTRRAFIELIEDHTPPGSSERRFALENVDVHFVDELPEI